MLLSRAYALRHDHFETLVLECVDKVLSDMTAFGLDAPIFDTAVLARYISVRTIGSLVNTANGLGLRNALIAAGFPAESISAYSNNKWTGMIPTFIAAIIKHCSPTHVTNFAGGYPCDSNLFVVPHVADGQNAAGVLAAFNNLGTAHTQEYARFMRYGSRTSLTFQMTPMSEYQTGSFLLRPVSDEDISCIVYSPINPALFDLHDACMAHFFNVARFMAPTQPVPPTALATFPGAGAFSFGLYHYELARIESSAVLRELHFIQTASLNTAPQPHVKPPSVSAPASQDNIGNPVTQNSPATVSDSQTEMPAGTEPPSKKAKGGDKGK